MARKEAVEMALRYLKWRRTMASPFSLLLYQSCVWMYPSFFNSTAPFRPGRMAPAERLPLGFVRVLRCYGNGIPGPEDRLRKLHSRGQRTSPEIRLQAIRDQSARRTGNHFQCTGLDRRGKMTFAFPSGSMGKIPPPCPAVCERGGLQRCVRIHRPLDQKMQWVRRGDRVRVRRPRDPRAPGG